MYAPAAPKPPPRFAFRVRFVDPRKTQTRSFITFRGSKKRSALYPHQHRARAHTPSLRSGSVCPSGHTAHSTSIISLAQPFLARHPFGFDLVPIWSWNEIFIGGLCLLRLNVFVCVLVGTIGATPRYVSDPDKPLTLIYSLLQIWTSF